MSAHYAVTGSGAPQSCATKSAALALGATLARSNPSVDVVKLGSSMGRSKTIALWQNGKRII